MKAYVLTRYAKNNSALSLQECPERAPGPGEVKLRIKAFALNPADLKTRDGESKLLLPFSPPFTPGVDLAGVVEAIGPGVQRLSVGDAVYSYTGMDRMGAFAESLTIEAERVAAAPANLDAAAAASLPLPCLCSWQALEAGRVRQGHRVLIHGGGGGVGWVAVQLALKRGAKVYTTASGDAASTLKTLGAEVIDYKTQRFEDIANDLDFVFDTVGGEATRRSLRCIKRGGVLSTLHSPPSAEVLTSAGLQVGALLRLLLPLASWGMRRAARRAGVMLDAQVTRPSAARLERISSLIKEGAIKPNLAKRFSMNALPAALDALQRGQLRGRIVVEV